MGIKGLIPFIKKFGPSGLKPVTMDYFAGKTLAFDMSIYMYKIFRTALEQGNSDDRLMAGMYSFYRYIDKMEITPILVFDSTKRNKMKGDTLVSRAKSKGRTKEEHGEEVERCKRLQNLSELSELVLEFVNMENLKELDNLSLKPKADMNDFIEILEKETKGMELGTKRTESLESNVKHNMVGDIEGTEKEGDEEEKKRHSDEMNAKQLGILLKMRLAYQRTIEANVVVEKDKIKPSKVKTIKTEYDKEELAVTKQLKVLCTKIFKYYLNPTAQSEQKIKHTETATATETATETATATTKTKTKTKITGTGLKGGGSNTSRAKKLDLDDANKTVNQVVVRLEDLAIRNYERLEKLKVRVENLDYAKQMECMKMAEDMGYYCIVAPEEIESEHLCAYLTTRKREITAKRTDKSSDTNVSGVKGGESGHDPDNGFYASGAASEDTDVLAFGGNVLVRNFSQYNATVELVDRAAVQRELGVTYQQFVDMCILFGSDFTGTLNKVGPVNALRLIKEYGSIEDILNSDDKLIVKYNSKITQNPHDTLTDSAPNSQQPGPHSEGFQGFDYKLVRKIFTSEPQLSIQTFQNIQDALDKYRRIPTEEKQKKFEQVAIKYGVATDAKEKREVFREFVF